MEGVRQSPHWLLVIVLVLPLALPWGALGSTGDANGLVVEDTGAEPLQVDYTVGFMTVPAGLDLEIDGIAYATPIEFIWEEGELHMIAALSPQDVGYGARYTWIMWSDMGTQVHPITILGDGNYTACYGIDYLVTIDSRPISIEIVVDGVPWPTPVQFWVPAGGMFMLGALPDVQVDNQTRYVFLRWEADPGFPGPLNETTITFTVGSPQNLTAVYELQYSLTYDAPWDIPSEWFRNGTTAHAGLDSPYNYTSPGARFAFDGWGGDASGNNHSQSDPILMDGPKTATVLWTTQYRVSIGGPGPIPMLVVIVDGVNYTMPFSFWCDQGISHSVFFPSPQGIGPHTQLAFLSWTGPSFLGNPATLVCDGPKSTSVVLYMQYRVDLYTSPIGLNLSADGVTYTAPVSFWWDADSPHYVYAPDYPPNLWWHHWSDGGAQGHDIVVTGPMTITAYYESQYEISFLGPAGLEVEVDSVSYTMPFSFWCGQGATHSVYFPSPQAVGPESRVAFLSWTHPDFLGNPATLVCDGPKSTSVVVMTQHLVNLTTNPVGLILEIDGLQYVAPHSAWWDEGSSHYVYAQDNPPDLWWHHWSDGGAQGHDIVVTGPMTVYASYILGVRVTITAEPLVPVLEVDGMQYAPPAVFTWGYSTLHTINAPSPQVTPNGTLNFSHWSDGRAQSHTIVVDGTDTYVAYYEGVVQVIIDTMPTSLQVYVDGAPHVTPKSFLFPIGSWHTIEALEMQGGGPNLSWRFSHWSDGGERTHSIKITGSGVYVAYHDAFYRIGVDTGPSGLNVSVNGTVFSTPESFWWKEGSAHELEAISPQESNGTRYLFIMWEDGYSLPKRTIVVSGVATYVALYKPQHYLSVIVPPPLISFGPVSIGTGWYDDGTLATAGLTVPELEYDAGRKWVFLSWEGDASGTDYRASEPMVMDRPRTALVAWKSQFLLTVESEYGSPTGGGWYDEGTLAVVTVEAEVSVGGNVYRFQGWSGGLSSQSDRVEVLMDSPALLRAHWSEVPEGPAGDIWPVVYVATTAALISAVVVASYVLWIRPGRKGGTP